jgi:hypothetical protein
LSKQENIVPKSPKEKTEDFIQRVARQMDELGIQAGEKAIILELLKSEIQYPTYNDKDALPRYRGVISDNIEG